VKWSGFSFFVFITGLAANGGGPWGKPFTNISRWAGRESRMVEVDGQHVNDCRRDSWANRKPNLHEGGAPSKTSGKTVAPGLEGRGLVVSRAGLADSGMDCVGQGGPACSPTSPDTYQVPAWVTGRAISAWPSSAMKSSPAIMAAGGRAAPHARLSVREAIRDAVPPPAPQVRSPSLPRTPEAILRSM